MTEADDDGLINQLEQLYLNNRPTSISQEIKPGYFYRVKNRTEPPAAAETVIGVYSKSIKYCDISLTEGTQFDIVSKHVNVFSVPSDRSNDEKNYLGVCFFGVLQDEAAKYNVVQIPVKVYHSDSQSLPNSDEPIKVWKTGRGEVEVTDGFEHTPCEGIHTETEAIKYLKDNQEALWKHFWEQVNNEVPIREDGRSILSLHCIGFQFFSKLDACDDCLKKLLRFKNHRLQYYPPSERESYKIKTLCDPVPLLISFTSKKFYNPRLPYIYHRQNCTVRNNTYNSASLVFYPRPKLLRLWKNDDEYKALGNEAGKSLVSKEDQRVTHQESVCLYEKQEFDFIVLNVKNEKDPIEIKEFLKF